MTAAPPRTVVLVTHYFAGHGGGVEIVAAELASRLAASAAIRWYASGPPGPTWPGLEMHVIPAWNGLERRLGLPVPVIGPASIARLARAASGADAVWVHDLIYPATFVAALAAALRRRRLIVTVHVGAIPYRNRLMAGLMKLVVRTTSRLVLPRATAVVFVSERVRDEFAAWLNLPRARLIPNGVDPAIYSPVEPAARPALRASIGLDDRPAVLFVGRFVERKGLPLLRELARSRPDLQWLFAGDGPLDPSSWMLPNVSVLRGRRGPSIAELYRAADLLALPSIGEGFPLVVAEALACGLPVIVDPSTVAGFAASAAVVAAEPVEGGDAPARWSRRIDEILSPAAAGIGPGERVAFARASWSWESAATRYRELLLGPAATNAARADPSREGG